MDSFSKHSSPLYQIGLVAFTIICGLRPFSVFTQIPVINEVLSNNETGLQDADGDRPDWIELYNPGSEPIEMLGYTMFADGDDEAPWIFPDIVLPAQGYVVVFASGKDRLDSEELHANFQMSSQGEWLYLHDPDGNPIDQVGMPALAQDRSFGRSPDGEETWSRLDLPTPGATNDLSNHLEFSHNPGFYPEEFYLHVWSLTGDSVFYTLDGSVPTPTSAFHTDSLPIIDRSGQPNVISEIATTPDDHYLIYWPAWKPPSETTAKATVLRLASFRNGVQTGDTYTLTYFVGTTADRYTMPVISLVTDAANFFNPDTGIYVPGVLFNPDDPDHPEHTGNYFGRGEEWERDVHIEYFPGDGPPAFSQDAGIRIHGNTSRQAAQKSLRLYARKEYGTQYFDYPLMPNRAVMEYKRFILRATMSSWEGQTLFTDDFAQTASAPLDIDHQDSRPVIVFLNGEYWGIHVIKDRLDDRYAGYVGSLDEDSVLFVKGFTSEFNVVNDYARDQDLSIASNYDSISAMMDINNYIDYQIAQQFFRNIDWPGNNMACWKPNSAVGKLRWILFDLDVAFGDPEYNMLEHTTLNDPSVSYPNPPIATNLFRALLENDDFRTRFIHRYAEVLNGPFRTEEILEVFDQIKSNYAPEVSEHIARWNYPRSYDGWNSDVEDLAQFVTERPCITEGHIIDFFGLTDFGFSCIIDAEQEVEIVLAPNPNDGAFSLYNATYRDWNNSTITLYDLQGMAVEQKVLGNLFIGEWMPVNFGTPAQGIYIVEIRSGTQVKRLKLVVSG